MRKAKGKAETEQIRKIGFWTVIRWLAIVFFAVIGFIALIQNYFAGVIFWFLAFFWTHHFNNLTKKRGFELSTTLKIIITAVIFFLTISILSASSHSSPSNYQMASSTSVTTTISSTEPKVTINVNAIPQPAALSHIESPSKVKPPVTDAKFSDFGNIRIGYRYQNPIIPSTYQNYLNLGLHTVVIRVINFGNQSIYDIKASSKIGSLTEDWTVSTLGELEPNAHLYDFDLLIAIPNQILFQYEQKVLPINFKVTYKDANGAVHDWENSDVVTIGSKNDFDWSATVDGNAYDYSNLIATFVTPRNPAIENLISDSKELMPDRAFVAYQAPPPRQLLEAKAIYNTIQKRGVSYVDSSISFSGQQSIRLPEDSLKFKGQANCIDGTVLFASAFERIGLRPLIALVPSHAFVGFTTDGTLNKAYFIETTMVGTSSFEDALNAGMKEYNAYASSNQISIVDVWAARNAKITPFD